MFNKLKQEAEYQAESLSEKGSWATSKPGVMGVQTWCEDARARELEPKGNLGYSQAWSYMGVQTWCEDAWARATGATGAWAAKGKLLSNPGCSDGGCEHIGQRLLRCTSPRAGQNPLSICCTWSSEFIHAGWRGNSFSSSTRGKCHWTMQKL